MPEKDFLSKLLSENSAPKELSSSEKFAAFLAVPKHPNLADQLAGFKNPQPSKPIFDDKEQRKEQMKEEPKNPKYTLTNKNLSRLIDKSDEHDSKIDMLCFKFAEMEDIQTSMQAEIAKINESTKELESKSAQKTFGIEWRSFAYGAIVLSCLWFFIHRLTP
jgi:hypothetical protein